MRIACLRAFVCACVCGIRGEGSIKNREDKSTEGEGEAIGGIESSLVGLMSTVL